MKTPPQKKVKHDFLKYGRVVRQFIKVKYNISQADLDMILFLYSEKYFKFSQFQEFQSLMGWDKKKLKTMIADGWIEVWRHRGEGHAKSTLYCLSMKANRAIGSLYRKLLGEEIPETPGTNPMFKKDVRYNDKVYRNMIKKMNMMTRKCRKENYDLDAEFPES